MLEEATGSTRLGSSPSRTVHPVCRSRPQVRRLRAASREASRPASAGPAPADAKSVFTEFVQLKRDLATLKAANERLTRQLALSGRVDASQLVPPRKEQQPAMQAPPPEPLGAILDRHSRTTPPEQPPPPAAGHKPQFPVPKLNPAAYEHGAAHAEADGAGSGFFGGLHGALPVGRRSMQRSRLQG